MSKKVQNDNLNSVLINTLLNSDKDSAEFLNIKTILLNSEDSAFIKDRNSCFLFAGEYLIIRFGVNDFSEIIGKTDFDFFSEDYARQAFDAEQTIINTGIPIIEAEEKGVLADGRVTWFLSSKYPLYDTSGNIIGTWGTCREITKQKQIEEKLEIVNKELEKNIITLEKSQKIIIEKEKLASLGQMIGGISHNLKTPIMSLSNGLEVLKNLIAEYDQSIENEMVTKFDHHEISKEMLSWVDKMKPLCTYMSDVISTVKSHAVHLNDSIISSFNLQELVKRIDILMKHELQRNNCKVNKYLLVDMNIELSGEINSLVQVFNNLLNNAIDAYENKGGVIDLKIYSENNFIVFSVKDNGKGISEEVQNNLFKSMVTTKGKNGTGLGLFMSYDTIKGRFNGDIQFESQEGKGTTFRIFIPYIKK
jgi:PAS domain S-box-containing protein